MRCFLLATALASLIAGTVRAQETEATSTHAIQTCSTSNAATYTTGAFTPAAGDLLLVMAVVSDTAAAGSVTSSVGTTFVAPPSFPSAVYRTSLDKVFFFIARDFSTAVSQTVTMDVTGDNGTGACVAVLRVAGMKRTGHGALRQPARQQNQAGGGTPAPAFGVAALTGNLTIGIIGNNTNAAGMTPPTGWNEGVADGGYATPTTGFEYVFRDSGFTGTTITWGSTSASTFASYIFEIDASSCATSNPMSLMGAGCK